MYSKLSSFFSISVLLAVFAASLGAQAPQQLPAAQPVAAPPSASLHGKIADPTGALIPGARVTINDATGHAVATATADSAGNYEVHSLPAGSYVVMAATEGFAPFVSPAIPLAAGQIKRVDISMAIQTEQQNVVVTDESPTVSVDPDSNANSLVIKGKDLDALSDDPDELSNELTALAGPSAGPNGGQIYIDGFTGGQLPPKSSIREIRVNQNPYSAEYDRLGFGRIESLTKPGTDKLHGQFFIQGNDSSFNTSDPFTKNIPSYYSYQYNGTLNGSLNKNTSFFISAERRNINNVNVYDVPCDEAGACEPAGLFFSGGIPNPRTRTNVSPRIDLQIGAKNTLTVRYQFYRDEASGNLGSTQLPEGQTGTTTNDNNIQISDTEVINDHIVNETRFQYERTVSQTVPFSTAPSFTVQQGSFSGGGSSGQTSHDHSDHLELQNLTTMSIGAQAIKFGTRLRDARDADFADSGFNGSFVFDTEKNFTQAIQAQSSAKPPATSSAAPIQLSYAAGNQNAIGNVFDLALFLQDDWKVNPRLTLSGGMRWETQNHVADHDDWAPRASLAWAVDGKNGKPAKTVVRGGYGIFYDRMGVGNFLTINRAEAQTQYLVTNTDQTWTCFLASATAFNNSKCDVGTANARSAYQIDPTYRSPYTQQLGGSIERQLGKVGTATVTFLHSTGIHQLVTLNTNPLGEVTKVRPNANFGNIYQYLPEGVFKQNQLIFNGNVRFNPNFNIFGFYTLSFANTDGAGGSSASLNSPTQRLSQDYGRAGFVSHNSIFMIANYTGPWKIRFNPFLIAQSGKPFNITLPTDNGNSFFNARPGVAAASECSSDPTRYISTAYGCLDTDPVVGEQILGINAGNGPAAVAVNLRISRTWGIGPKLVKFDPNANQQDGPPRGGPPPGGGGPGGGPGGGGGGRGGGPGGGGGFGGPPGGMGGVTSDRKYNLNFSVQALNLFNDIDYGQPIGTLTNPRFGQSTALSPGIFSQGSAPRRIFMQAVFSF